MKDSDNQVSRPRREFLRNVGIGGGVAMVTAAVPAVADVAPAEAEQKKPEQKGYRLSQHVLDYYKSAAS